MHLSGPSSPGQVDINGLASARNELVAVLQKEQDEAMALLDANPFISSLLVKYSRESAAKSLLPENEELVALRTAQNALLQDQEWFQTELETAKQQKKAAETISVGLEIQLASAVEEKYKVLEENQKLKDSMANAEMSLSDAQAEIAELKSKAEYELSSSRKELAETMERAALEANLAEAEIEKLKTRCEFLWETVSERTSPNIPTTSIKDATDSNVKQDPEPSLEPPLKHPASVQSPQDIPEKVELSTSNDSNAESKPTPVAEKSQPTIELPKTKSSKTTALESKPAERTEIKKQREEFKAADPKKTPNKQKSHKESQKQVAPEPLFQAFSQWAYMFSSSSSD